MEITSKAFVTGIVSRAKGSIPDNQKDPFVKIHIFRHIITAEKDGSRTCFGRLWRRDSSSSILFLHGIWWSFVRILTSKPRIWTNRLGFKFKKGCYLRESLIHSRWVSSAIYWTPKFHRDSSSANRYLIASLQLLIRASLCCICFFWWILRGAEIGGEGVYIRW